MPAEQAAAGWEHEEREEEALRAGAGAIYGIPRAEWLKLQSPARYLGECPTLRRRREGAGGSAQLAMTSILDGKCSMADMLLRGSPLCWSCAECKTAPMCLGAGNEFGAVHKPWDSAEIRFALTYPEIYEVSIVGGGVEWPGAIRCMPACQKQGRSCKAFLPPEWARLLAHAISSRSAPVG